MIASSLFFAMKVNGKPKKETTRKKFYPIHFHETRRGRGRSCWVKAEKTFASRAKRKRKKEKKRKGKCAYMYEQTLPRQAQAVLTAIMHDIGIHCVDLGHVALQLHFTVLAALPCFVRSRYVRVAATLLSISQARKWFPSLRSLTFEVARDFYVTKQRISISWGVCRLLGCSRRAPSAALRLYCRRLLASPRGLGSQTLEFVPVAQTQFPSEVPLYADLPWKSPCRLQSCHAQGLCSRKETEPSRRPTACGIVDRSMDPEVLTAKGQLPHDEACRSLRTSTVSGRLPTAVTSS